MDDIFDTRFEGKEVKISDNRAKLGEDINLTARDPALRKLIIGVGWDSNAFDAEALDLDLSMFLNGKDGKTRVDEDFVFYNNPQTLAGAVRHMGDSRTGAGEGDDETIEIDLHGVPFDVMQLVFSLSIYRGPEKELALGMVSGAYIRILNAETRHELIRYELDAHLKEREESGMIMALLNREGPKWHFVPKADFEADGLGPIATRYGLDIISS